jgi:hypothetical protein
MAPQASRLTSGGKARDSETAAGPPGMIVGSGLAFLAFLDTCALFGAYLCDTLLCLAEAGAYWPLPGVFHPALRHHCGLPGRLPARPARPLSGYDDRGPACPAKGMMSPPMTVEELPGAPRRRGSTEVLGRSAAAFVSIPSQRRPVIWQPARRTIPRRSASGFPANHDHLQRFGYQVINRTSRHYAEALLLDCLLVTTTYKFEEVNEGYADVRAGKNLRGVIHYTDADY